MVRRNFFRSCVGALLGALGLSAGRVRAKDIEFSVQWTRMNAEVTATYESFWKAVADSANAANPIPQTTTEGSANA